MKHAHIFSLALLLAGTSAAAQSAGTTATVAFSERSPTALPPKTPELANQVNPSNSGDTSASTAQQFTLKNGMQLIVQPDRRAPTAIHMLWLRVGAMDEVDGTSGVAHALEHMMFKGSKALAPGDFSRRVAALGGQENAFTSWDYTGYYQQVPAHQLREVMRMEAERFAHSQWPDAEFTKEIEVIKEERRMRTDDRPRARLMELFYATAFVAAPYHRPIIGWMGDLDAMTPHDVRQFYRQWYVPGHAAVVVAGDVDVAQVRAWAEQYYGSIAEGEPVVRKPRPEPVQRGLRQVQLKAQAQQAYVMLGFQAPRLQRVHPLTAQDRDALALLMLSEVLSGYDGARLEQALTQGAARLADSASSGASVLGRGPGLFMLTGVPAPGKTAEQVVQGLRAEIDRIAREGVAPAELERVKTQWMAGRVYGKDSLMGQAQQLGFYWVLDMPLDAEARLLEALQTIDAAQVQSVAQRYFGDDTLTIATLVPELPSPQAAQPQPGGAPSQ